ncbi:hypothetical protein J6590_080374 [Homalodisca vitripennis]|nr:hypothetical protein J6590_080374 [Homalodisca vitripennis]
MTTTRCGGLLSPISSLSNNRRRALRAFVVKRLSTWMIHHYTKQPPTCTPVQVTYHTTKEYHLSTAINC